jgi:malonyl-CoA/methylmalonyl-CoA synthetase
LSENLYTRLESLSSDGARPFMHLSDGAVCSYAAMHSRTAQLANALLDLGIQAGDRVVVQVDKSAEAVFLYLACLRVAAVYVPLNTAYTLAELEYFVADTEPRLLVCTSARLTALLPLAHRLKVAHVVTLDAAGTGGSLSGRAHAQPDSCFDVDCAADSPAAILYTSGTTGRSKGAVLSHGNLAANGFALKACWRYTSADVLLHALPIFHIHGLFVALNATLAAGASLILVPNFDPSLWFERLPKATVFMGVPTHYVRLLGDARLDRAHTAHMRLFVSGSAPLQPETHRAWAERTGHTILERYGMTETGIISSNPYGGERLAGTVGQPLPGVSVRVVDAETGLAVARGEQGMIEVSGPNVFAGYWRRPDKTRAEFRADGYFVTGDIGRFDERGYLHIVGRGKDLIITGGFNVYPREVEIELDALPGVGESAVVGLPHPDFGEGVTAMIVRAGPAPLSEEGVLALLKARLAGYKCPKRVLFLEELPRNTMGKVQKNVLRERYQDLYAPTDRALGAQP